MLIGLIIVPRIYFYRNNITFSLKQKPVEKYQCNLNTNLTQAKYSEWHKKKSDAKTFNTETSNTEDLIPIDDDAVEWSKMHPNGKGSLRYKNMLSAGTHIGINTLGANNQKNTNQSLRSEYANPIIPENAVNYEDIFRKQLK